MADNDMETRLYRIHKAVLGAIDNDFEDFEMIVSEATKWLAEEGIEVERKEIWKSLQVLLDSGKARVYVYTKKGQFIRCHDQSEDPNVKRHYYISKDKAITRGL